MLEAWIVVCNDRHGAAGMFTRLEDAEKKAEEMSGEGGCVYTPMPLFFSAASIMDVLFAASLTPPGSEN